MSPEAIEAMQQDAEESKSDAIQRREYNAALLKELQASAQHKMGIQRHIIVTSLGEALSGKGGSGAQQRAAKILKVLENGGFKFIIPTTIAGNTPLMKALGLNAPIVVDEVTMKELGTEGNMFQKYFEPKNIYENLNINDLNTLKFDLK